VSALPEGTPKADVLKALGPPLPAGSLSRENERLPDDCVSQLLYKETPDSKLLRFVDDKPGSGGVWYRICFDDKDRMKSGVQLILIAH
jgi:hypothetical protein